VLARQGIYARSADEWKPFEKAGSRARGRQQHQATNCILEHPVDLPELTYWFQLLLDQTISDIGCAAMFGANRQPAAIGCASDSIDLNLFAWPAPAS
jgi:hypothetical protein